MRKPRKLTDAQVARALGWVKRLVTTRRISKNVYHDWYYKDVFQRPVEDTCPEEGALGFRPTTEITHILQVLEEQRVWWELVPTEWSKTSGSTRYRATIKDIDFFEGVASTPAMALSLALVRWAEGRF